MRVFPATFGAKDDQGSLTVFGENARLKVTRFQRTYTWEEAQWELLKDDIRYMANENELVAWPSLILQQANNVKIPNQQIYWIGDGQQRITTVYICLLAIWQSARERVSMVDSGRTWIEELLPDARKDKPGTLGLLGDVVLGVYRPVIDPKLHFSSDAIQKDIKLLVRALEEDDWLTIEARIEGKDESSGLFRAFRYFYEWAESHDAQELERYVELILSSIRLSAVVFDQNENMERAYGNMNSGGRPLTEDELVKARIYSYLKDTHGEELADSMADFWISEFEDKTWWRERGVTKKTATANTVHNFLEDRYRVETKWRIEAKRYTSDAQHRRGAHWLSNEWSTLLSGFGSDPAVAEAFWSTLQHDKLNYEVIKGKELRSYPKGSVKWLANYAHTAMGGMESVILYLMRKIEDQEELKRTLWLFIRYSTFLRVVNEETNFLQILVKSGSPLYDDELSHDAFLRWFCSMDKKARWSSKEEIQKRLSERVFKNPTNSALTNLFIYVNNRKAEDSRNRESLFSRDTESLDPAKSREHILSQKPKGYDLWSEETRKNHDELVGRLGNTLIISSTKNSELQNKPVADKLSTYRSEANSLVGTFWVQDFLDDYTDSGSWGRDEILLRSVKLAEEIAPYLTHPELPKSDDEEELWTQDTLTPSTGSE